MQLRKDQIGSRSPLRRLRRLDGRTRAAKFIKHTENDLVRHLGGPERVNLPKRLLIERVAVDLFRLELLDENLAERGFLTDHEARIAHALRNTIRRTLHEVG